MKRSEMVNSLIYFVYAATMGDIDILPTEASQILECLEEVGMLPPTYKNPTLGEISEWEPEEEATKKKRKTNE